MALRETLNEEMKNAMREKNQPRLDAIRLIIAKMKEQDIAARPSGNLDGITEEQILSMLQGMVKSRRESIDMYQKGGRAELADKEQVEIDVIQSFLPAQMDEAAVRAAITAAIAETGAASPKDMGKVIGVLKGKYTGQMDFGLASPLVKEMLG